MRSRFTGALALLLCSLAVTYAQTPEDSLTGLTSRMRLLRRGFPTAEFARTAQTRAARMRDLMRQDPRAAVAAALPESEAAAMRTWAPDLVETAGQWEGSLEVRVEDDFDGSRGRTRYVLKTALEELELFPTDRPSDTGCAPRVKVTGFRLAGDMAGAIEVVEPLAACSLSGQQRMAVILINFSGSSLPGGVTPSFVSSAFFGATRSVDTFFRENSYSGTSATGQVFGPYATSLTSCSNTSSMRSAAIAAADADVNFTQYTRLVVIHPNVGGCSVGVGTIGCSSLSSGDGSFTASTAWMQASYLQSSSHVISVASHELGHNLGLQHASTADYGNQALGAPGASSTYNEYWDLYSAMGLSFNSGGTIIIGHYNAPQKATLGWLGNGSGYQTVTTNGSYTVLPMASTASGTKGLRVQRPGTNKWVWIEYRQSLGSFDNTLGAYSSNIYQGALIHYEDPNEANYPETLLLDFTPAAVPNNFRDAALSGGSSWADPYSNLSITLGGASPSGLPVTISFNAVSPCDLNADGSTNIVDVQLSVNKALGIAACGAGDIDGDGSCTVVDLTRIITAVLGGSCAVGS